MSTALEQLKLLLWRNRLIKMRDRRGTMIEIGLPLLFFIIL